MDISEWGLKLGDILTISTADDDRVLQTERNGVWVGEADVAIVNLYSGYNAHVYSIKYVDGQGVATKIKLQTHLENGGYAHLYTTQGSHALLVNSDPVVDGTPIHPTSSPTSSPTISPTSSPTPSPTPSPTLSAPTATPIINGPMVAGVGDPHLVNTHGQKFDLFQAGYHTLINIPRWARQRANFLVQARASRAGAGCADLYFTEINISGSWVHRHKAADLRWVAEAVRPGKAKWMKFHNKINVKIVHGHTVHNTMYLNILVKGLDKTKAPVGGLLGQDDHTAATTPDKGCKKLISL